MNDDTSCSSETNTNEQKFEQQHEKTSDNRDTRVAVIGTGLAGLTTAYLLGHDKQERFSLTLFEQAKAFSLDATSVTMVHEKTGTRERVDIPPRSFCRAYYTNLCRMYDFLGIHLQQISLIWIFSVALNVGAPDVPGSESSDLMSDSYFVYGKGLYGLVLLWRYFWSKGIRQVLETLYLVFCHSWLCACCFLVKPGAARPKETVGDGTDSALQAIGVCESFGAYLRRIRLSQWYVNRYLLPVVSIVCSCPHAEVLAFPANDVIGFVRGSFRQKFFVNQDGINRVQAKLSEGIRDVRLQARVLKVEPVDGKVLIRWQCTEDDDGGGGGGGGGGGCTILEEVFDRVVLAVAPNAAASLFDKAKPMLDRIPTSSIKMSLLAPPAEEISIVQEESHIQAGQCTYRGGDTQTMVFRTSFSADNADTEALHYLPNGVVVKATSSALGERSMEMLATARFPRTLRTAESRSVTAMITRETRSPGSSEVWYSGRDNVWVVGSWCWDGLVLLEGCVVSAMRVAKDFGVEVPW